MKTTQIVLLASALVVTGLTSPALAQGSGGETARERYEGAVIGTANLATGPAMKPEQLSQALNMGR